MSLWIHSGIGKTLKHCFKASLVWAPVAALVAVPTLDRKTTSVPTRMYFLPWDGFRGPTQSICQVFPRVLSCLIC